MRWWRSGVTYLGRRRGNVMKMKEFKYKVYVYNIKRTTYNGKEEEYITEVSELLSSPVELLRFHQNIGDTNIQIDFIKEKEKIGYSVSQ